jgi:hypothetical protein
VRSLDNPRHASMSTEHQPGHLPTVPEGRGSISNTVLRVAAAFWSLFAGYGLLHLIPACIQTRNLHSMCAAALCFAVGTLAIGVAQLRAWAWAPAVASAGIYSLLTATISVVLFCSLVQEPFGTTGVGFVYAAVIGGSVVAVFVATAKLAWDQWRPFGIAEEHRWRALVRVGLPVSIFLVALNLFAIMRPK